MATLSGTLSALFGKIETAVGKWGEIKASFEAVFEERDLDPTLASRVVTVAAAQEVLEELRIGAIKDRGLAIYETILGILQHTIHPVGGDAAGDKAIKEGAIAFAGKPLPGITAGLIVQNLELGVAQLPDRIVELEDQILAAIKLIDYVKDMQDKIAAAALSQTNKQQSVTAKARQRVGSLHS